MKQTTLIVPGYLGSGPAHWQSWFERQLPDARRVSTGSTGTPRTLLAGPAPSEMPSTASGIRSGWSRTVSAASPASSLPRPGPGVWPALCWSPRLIPPDFRMLGSVHLQALAKTLCIVSGDAVSDCPGLVVASSNDPWMNFSTAAYWAQRWGCRLENLGHAGHINTDSGYGPWPLGLQLLRDLQAGHGSFLLGVLDTHLSLLPTA